MNYLSWCKKLFGNPADSDPVMLELSEDFYALPEITALDYIDRCLRDSKIHTLYTKEQIGIGLQIIFNSSCSDLPFCYVQGAEEARRITAIENLRFIYTNYFERYCSAPVERVGYDLNDGQIGYLCYMFWDIFVLWPGNASEPMINAAVEVMEMAISSANDNCVVSAIHGLGHWVQQDTSGAQSVLEGWLQHPSSQNAAVLEYAEQAKTGCIQ